MSTRVVRRSRWWRQLFAPLALCLLAVASGCLTVDATLEADGSGNIDLTYLMPKESTEAKEKASLQSDHLTVESFELKDGTVHAKVKVDDVTKLSTASFFKDVNVTLDDEGDDKMLKVVITKATTAEVKNESLRGPKFTFHLPGRVVKANRDAETSGDQVTWSFPLATYTAEKETTLEVTYAPEAAGGEGEAAEPAADRTPAAE